MLCENNLIENLQQVQFYFKCHYIKTNNFFFTLFPVCTENERNCEIEPRYVLNQYHNRTVTSLMSCHFCFDFVSQREAQNRDEGQKSVGDPPV